MGPQQRHPRQPVSPKAPGEDASELPLEGQVGIFYVKMAYGVGRRVFWVERTARTKAWSKGQCDALKSTRSENGAER